MKVGILTLIEYSNYGNRLQHFAMKHVLETKFDAEVVSVTTSLDVPNRPATTMTEAIKKWWRSLKYGFNLQERATRLRDFSERYAVGVEEQEPVDVVVVGSNHVWNPAILTMQQFRRFMLEGIKAEKKVAYAGGASGRHWSHELAKVATAALCKFDHISVAGPATQRQLLQVAGIQAPIVLDPVLLLTAEEWCDALSINVEKQPVAVTYFRKEQTPDMQEFVNRVATVKDLRIEANHSLDKRHVASYAKDPATFVKDIASAEIVFTDSFHVAALALMFGTPFVVQKSGKHKVDSSQLLRLLKDLDLEHRLFERMSEVSEAFDVTYEQAHQRLAEQRQTSLNFLREAVTV